MKLSVIINYLGLAENIRLFLDEEEYWDGLVMDIPWLYLNWEMVETEENWAPIRSFIDENGESRLGIVLREVKFKNF